MSETLNDLRGEEGFADKKDECRFENKERFIHYKDLDVVLKYAAELLYKQDLCTREKPGKHVFYELATKKCSCNQCVLSIKKVP